MQYILVAECNQCCLVLEKLDRWLPLESRHNYIAYFFPAFSNQRYGFNGFHSNSLLGVTDSCYGLKFTVLASYAIRLLS